MKKVKVGRVSGYPVLVKQGVVDHEAILLGCDDPHDFLKNNVNSKVKIRWKVAGYNDMVSAASVSLQQDIWLTDEKVPHNGKKTQHEKESNGGDIHIQHNNNSNSKKSNGKSSTKKKAFAAEKAASPAARGRSKSPAAKKKKAPAKKPPATKKKLPAAAASKQKYAVGTTVSKVFVDEEMGEERPFSGSVIGYDTVEKLYSVKYEDGDEEEFDEEELIEILDEGGSGKMQGKKRKITSNHNDKKKPRTTTNELPQDSVKDKQPIEIITSRSGRRMKKVSYAADDYDDDDESEEEDEMPQKKKRASYGNVKVVKGRGKKKRHTSHDDNSDDFMPDSESEQENESELEMESEEEEYKRSSSTNKKPKAAAAKPKKKMADSFKPTNNPVYWDKKMSSAKIKETFTFLDPCGLEATDYIIDRLVGEQLDKISNLLKRALTSEDIEMLNNAKTQRKEMDALGSRTNPLTLGTACSGTDAPALALMLVQEQLEKRGMGDLFKYDHVFSCEKEPYKQSYLARNFDSILYPDIVQLSDDPPKDVYGQHQPVPAFNMFVAGTSCKNFSMLMSNKRRDIEDLGCSGETFLAACEVLFKEKPRYAIFENVTKAPWAKMSEYITGRIDISGKIDKAISSTGKKGGGELEFVRDGDAILIERVPAQYGVRCGAKVEGFCKVGSTKVHPIYWPCDVTNRKCHLTEIIKYNEINPKTDLLIVGNEVTYCTHLIKVDTKDYGLPQTRQRAYLFVWQPDDGIFDDDLGQYWEAVVRHLRSPVCHSLESFILQSDHEIIRTFREALRGPAGRHTMRGINLVPDFFKSPDKDLPHNKNTRVGIGVENLARTQTQWGPFGEMHIPPHWWLEYMKCNTQRRCDLLDILHASAARDAESKDSNFASHAWNISQNASKEKHRTAVPGIASCITPGGDIFLPHMGRPLLGCEKLLLQGIPYFRLLLGNETEVQLGDLAGNAMSLSVVCATLLGAMTCKQLREDHKQSNADDILATLDSFATKDIYNPTCPQETHQMMITDKTVTDTKSLFKNLTKLAKAAIQSSILCTCESSGRLSCNLNFLRCSICSVSVCRDCVHTKQGYQLQSHKITEVGISPQEHDMGLFETSLRSLLPASLIFSNDGFAEIAAIDDDKYRVSGLCGYTFGLHRIKRDNLKWCVVYYARKDGIGEAVAEFKITIGELEGRSEGTNPAIGVQGQLTSFLPAKIEPLVRGELPPCILVRQYFGESDMIWKAKVVDTETSLSIVGTKMVPSFRVEVGLTDVAANALQNHATNVRKKEFAAAQANGDEHRWLYPSNWEVWPSIITIKEGRECDGKATFNLSGTYIKAGCKHTFNQNACWIRKKRETNPELYLLIKPDVSRVMPDQAIISTSTNHNDTTAILAYLPNKWQPCDALIEDMQKVNVTIANWINSKSITCSSFKTNFTVESPKSGPVLIKMNGLSNSNMVDICRNDVSGLEKVVHLNVHKGAKANQTIKIFNLICVSPFLKQAADNGLQYDLKVNAPYIHLKPKHDDIPFGCCKLTVPPRPTETWSFNKERSEWERSSEPGAARRYYLALGRSPHCFDYIADRNAGSLTVNCEPEVVAHRAAFGLIDGRNHIEREVSVSFRLSSTQEDPILERFLLHNCSELPMTTIALEKPHKLYERQKKVLTKMIRVESGEIVFDEQEMSEEIMPGSTGWSIIAKASKPASLRGGVIADAIGSGKTVISIAIILNGLKLARENCSFPRKSSATLVVVPPGLIDQWKFEINKFTTAMPNVLCIYDTNALQQCSVRDIVTADVVICPVDILEDGKKTYMTHMANVNTGKKGTLSKKEVPQLPSETGQVEKNGASGVWFPASSQDPYGGANNPRSQKRREESAYFTYVYHDYIHKLRAKEFKPEEKGIPLEYFEWERVFVDEIHEILCTSKDEIKDAREQSKKDPKDSGFFKEKNRRAGREFLGITTKNISQRPLVFRTAIFGLTATPLLDSTNRVIELANLMGGAYITGLSNHWRNLEKESGRDIFLGNFLEPRQGREVRRNIYKKCQEYLDLAACKNKNEEDMEGIELVEHSVKITMSSPESELYLKSQHGIAQKDQSYAIKPEDFDPTAGHDVSRFLRQNANIVSRGQKLVEICKQILSEDGNSNTKIIVFTDGRIGAGKCAREFLFKDGIGCTYLDAEDTVEMKNKKLAWYQYADVTDEDKKRPRVLVLHFEHAAGLNLQAECNHMILFTPLYIGVGCTSGDPVSDASTELQAIGRVFRPGQPKPKVHVYRLELLGINGEEALDSHLIRRNTDKETIQMAVNAAD